MPIMRGRMEDDSVNAYVIGVEEEEDDKIRYCESCKDNGYIVRLKRRLYFTLDKSGKRVATEPEHDSDLFRQCWNCGEVYRIVEAKIEGSLSDVIEVDEANSNEPPIQVLFPRKKGKGGRLQKLRESNTRNKIKDKDVIKAIRQGEHVTRYDEYQLD